MDVTEDIGAIEVRGVVSAVSVSNGMLPSTTPTAEAEEPRGALRTFELEPFLDDDKDGEPNATLCGWDGLIALLEALEEGKFGDACLRKLAMSSSKIRSRVIKSAGITLLIDDRST